MSTQQQTFWSQQQKKRRNDAEYKKTPKWKRKQIEVPIQNTKNKRKRNEERNDGHSMMEKNVLAIYNDMAVKEQASIKRVHGSNTS
jgi:hypothetical protein